MNNRSTTMIPYINTTVKANPHSFAVTETIKRYHNGQEHYETIRRPATQDEINIRRVRLNEALANRIAPELTKQFWELLDQRDKWQEEVVWARHFPFDSNPDAENNVRRVEIQLN